MNEIRGVEAVRRLVLLPGWALGPEPLHPLAEALESRVPGLEVACYRYPALASRRLDVWLEVLDEEIASGCWLGGWSLGGMLAAMLAERRGRGACGLVSMASNASFVARPGWARAMARESFDDFGAELQRTPLTALRRFALLSARGGQDARRLGEQLIDSLSQLPSDQASAGLSLLGQLDLREALAGLEIPQLHLFGERDVLVPASARRAIAGLLPDGGRTHLLAGAGHGFPIERTSECADLIADFMTAGREA